jgi:hypothetical protein
MVTLIARSHGPRRGLGKIVRRNPPAVALSPTIIPKSRIFAVVTMVMTRSAWAQSLMLVLPLDYDFLHSAWTHLRMLILVHSCTCPTSSCRNRR